MGFDLANTQTWRISYANETFSICNSYPKYHIVPAKMTDEDVSQMASFRAMQRFPSVVWRDQRNGMVIARCSQPQQGLLSWRSTADENFFHLLLQTCLPPQPVLLTDLEQQSVVSGISGNICESQIINRKVLVIDARSYTSAWANRAKGGGVECPEYYPHCEIQYMNLANIHSIRKSFVALRGLCTQSSEQTSWLSGLETTAWLLHLSGLMKTAMVVVNAIDTELRPVVVHCSDGWDRTPQIVSLAEIMLDPYYRTITGFCILIQREWVDFGHKFADRCGHYGCCSDTNERSPVFLLWLDCVHQLLQQFPCAFQFNMAFLVKLAQHVYSCLFGTFLTNTAKESEQEKVRDATFSVWSLLLHCSTYMNGLYKPINQVLRPSIKPQVLQFWKAIYMTDIGETVVPDACDDHAIIDIPDNVLPRTKSCDNIVKAITNDIPAPSDVCKRRNSDTSLQRSITRNDQFLADGEINKTTDPSKDTNAFDVENYLLSDNCKDVTNPCLAVRDDESGETFDDDKTVENGVGSTETLKELATSPRHDPFSSIPQRWIRGGSSEASTSTTDLSRLVLRANPVKNMSADQTEGISAELASLLKLNSKCRCATTPVDVTAKTLSSGCNLQRSVTEIKTNIVRMLDPDGLTHFNDVVQRRLREVRAEYSNQLHSLLAQLQQAKRLLDYYKSCNGIIKPGDVRDDLLCPDLCELPVDRGEVSSTPASDASWDQVDEQDNHLTLWVPDHVAAHCDRCETRFSMIVRKHHCRNCGKVFCAECSKHMVPIPEQNLNAPSRVCDRCYESLSRTLSPPVD